MIKIIRLLLLLINAALSIGNDRPRTRYISQYGLDEDLDSGLISLAEYNQARQQERY